MTSNDPLKLMVGAASGGLASPLSVREVPMSIEQQVSDILQALKALPPEKLSQVRDYVQFLSERYGKERVADGEEFGTEKDMAALTAATWEYADEVVPWDDSPPQPSQAPEPR
jgi:hypothetical protein